MTLVFIPKLESKQLHLSMEDSTIFLSVLGLTNFISRLVVGWVCQKKMACPLILHCLGLLGSSVCLILYHFITNYWLMAAAVAIQGVAQVWLLIQILSLYFSIKASQNRRGSTQFRVSDHLGSTTSHPWLASICPHD